MRSYITLCVQIIIITIHFVAILFSMYPLRWALQGMELYPRIGKNFDIKVFTNCRFGMMSWAVLAVTYCIKQVLLDTFPLCYDITWMFLWVLIWSESLTLLICGPYTFLYQYEINGRVSDSMLVNTILMLVYVTKFFGWEAGYWNSMDIAHDRGMRLVHISKLHHHEQNLLHYLAIISLRVLFMWLMQKQMVQIFELYDWWFFHTL